MFDIVLARFCRTYPISQLKFKREYLSSLLCTVDRDNERKIMVL